MRWRDVRWPATDFYPEYAPWLTRLLARLARRNRTAEADQPEPGLRGRATVWDDPWIDLGGEG
jgi:hypothetical protein